MSGPQLNRRDLIAGATGAVSSLLPTSSSRAGRPAAVMEKEHERLSPGIHLLLDDYWIAEQNGITRAIKSPERVRHPIVTGKEDGNFQPYLSVLRDSETKRFRMWYDVAVDAGQAHIGYLESEDGVRWIRPHRVLSDPARIVFGASVLDDGPGFRDPARRYKLAWWNDGLQMAFSPDGIAWTAASNRPVLSGISDIVFLCRDPIRNRYLLTCKVDSRPEDGYKGHTQNSTEGYRRCVGQSVSDDCIHWQPARRVIQPDDRDEGITEFYSIGGVIARGDLLIGLLKVLRDDLAQEPGAAVNGIGYTALAWSRDGETWQRDRKPFLDRNPLPGAWDRAMTWGDYQLIVGDELFLYYGGYARGHKVERLTERQIGLARTRRDRYVAREAGPQGGSLRTPLVVSRGAGLTVNADVRGELKVRIVDENGNDRPGFGARDCAPIRSDSLRHTVRWKRPFATLQGKPIRFEFRMRDAGLYGFEIEEQP